MIDEADPVCARSPALLGLLGLQAVRPAAVAATPAASAPFMKFLRDKFCVDSCSMVSSSLVAFCCLERGFAAAGEEFRQTPENTKNSNVENW